ncbi:ABC transporter ATP-binding protein [Portibacter marinus]|uniref:ABC transporter ATP-binding protein n=1 Tax=Portibacter marinus TaxID=2898660 RepID=UPI001F3600FF|nr:ABC transporter ATP-binding protein [Portibacter marinus]
MILEVSEVSKVYEGVNRSLTVLDDINFSVEEGETVAIVGASGSGKTTLLGLCAGLDVSSSGEIRLVNHHLNLLSENDKAEVRNKHIGFIFQNFQLLPTLTAMENVMLPLELQDKAAEAGHKAKELLERVGLGDRMNHYPNQLSGGEQQRVSLARAFSNTPDILFADEPTGNLDDETSVVVEKLLFDLNKEHNTTLVIVTHDMELARKTSRIIRLKGGKIMTDEKVKA